MPAPVDFFSTIVQASAGILGIIVAVMGVIHSINVQSRTPRTKNLYNSLIDLQDEYQASFREISLALTGEIQDGLYQEMLEDNGKCSEILRNTQKYNNTQILQAHVYRVEKYLSSSKLRSYHTISDQQLNAITDSAEWLMTKTSHTDVSEQVFEDTTGNPASSGYMYQRIFPKNQSLKNWLDNIGKSSKQGDDLESFSILFMKFGRDVISSIHHGRQESLVDYDSPLRPTIIAIGLLLVIGIFVPSLFLLHTSNPIYILSSNTIFGIQLIILLCVIVIAGYLLYIMLDNMS